ncbi:choice-of-anchor L domain-containing protein, partial [Flavobacterium suzhouense]
MDRNTGSTSGGWAVYNQIGNITWKQTTLGDTNTPPKTGSYAAYLQRENVLPGTPIPTNWLITPQFNAPNEGLLHFFSRLTLVGDQGGIYKIKIATVNDPLLPIQNLTWVDLVPPMSELTLNPVQTNYIEKTFNIPATYTGQQIRIAFVMEGDQQDRWIIDDVEAISLCHPVTNLMANNVTLSGAELNWTSPAGVTSWEIQIIPENEAFNGSGNEYNGPLPYIASNLQEKTPYKYYVRSLCGDGGKSSWTGPYQFTTAAVGEKCENPIVIPSVLPYSTINTTLNFGDYYDGAPGTGCGTTGNYLSGNDVVYSYTPTENGIINITLSNTGGAAGVFVYNSCTTIGYSCLAGVLSSATASGVIPSFSVTAGTTYYIVVSSLVLNTNYTLTLQKVSCAAPTGLTIGTTTQSSTSVSWAAGTATSWQLYVQPTGMGIPAGTGQNVTQNTNLTLSATTAGVPFTSSTSYEVYVRANCGDGTYSIWTGPVNFSTTQVPVNLGYTENFDGSVAHGWTILNALQPNKWAVAGATSNSGTNSLYISNNNGVNNNYTITSASVVHAYRDIIIPAGTQNIGLTFDFKAGGESGNVYVRAWIVPTTFMPTPGTQLTSANSGGLQFGGNFNSSPEWSTQNTILNVASIAGSTRRIVFEWRNNATFGIQPAAAIDNIKIDAQTCLPPTGLTPSNVTSNSVTFNWTAPTGTSPAGYEYYYSVTTAPPSDVTAGMGSVSAPTTTVVIPSLTPSQTYYVWVRSTCGSVKSFWTGPVSATLTQVPETLGFTQNFDGATNGFSKTNQLNGNGWAVGNATSNSPSKSLYVSADNGITNSYNPTVTTVIHAYRDFVIPNNAAEIRVSFDYKVGGDSNDYLRAWIIPAATVPVLGTQTVSSAVNYQLGGNFTSAPQWTTATYDVPVTAYQGQTRRIVFEWRSNTSGEFVPPAAIDNISITVLPCAKPTNLSAINITTTNATLDWAEPSSATNWEVAFMPSANAATPTTAGIPVTTTEYTPAVGTFVSGVQYVFYVRSVCGGSAGSSEWSGPFYFGLKAANDECLEAVTVLTNPDKTCTNFANGSVTGATASPEASSCAGTKDDDIWFQFVATNTKHIISLNNVTGSTTDLSHALYSGNCGALTQLYCNTTALLSSVAQNLTIGQTYKIRVWSTTSDPNQNSTFQLCITTPPTPPANDECINAVALTVNPDLNCGVYTAGTVESATASPQTSSCSGTADDDVWYKFTATNTTHRISIGDIHDPLLSSVSMNFVLYSGTCGTLAQMACNPNNQTELWTSGLTIGQTYYIKIYTNGSYPGFTTTFKVCVGTPAPPPANDNCNTATVVGVNPTLDCVITAHGAIQSATASPESNSCSNVNDDDDIWFEFVATSTSHIIDLKNFVGNGAGIISNVTNLYHVLYSGTNCGTLTQVFCSAANNSLATNLTVGQTYKVRVYSETITPNQDCQFDICITTPPATVLNDNCSTATVIPVNPDSYCNVHASGSIAGATASPLANQCAGTADDDIWFEFTATNTQQLIYINNIIGTTTGLYHSVYNGDCSALNLLFCSSSTNSNYDNYVVGTTYKVRVYSSTASPNQTASFDICVRVPNKPITVEDSTYTAEQLVKDILFNTPCATVSNVTSKTGLNYGSVPSLGYFDASNSYFPFDYGVVLATGNVNLSEGPYTSNSFANPYEWLGDSDLNNIILQNDISQDNGINNATALEFDFIPLINKFEFEFLFASSEYGNFQCNLGDAFAFILTDQNGNSQNLAVIPNTNVPVRVTTIRDSQYRPDCGSVNPEYFGQFNEGQPLASAINYSGQTQSMVASATVIPGQNYHIKLVIADYSDTSVSSAVFLGGGTFNVGIVDLGTDLLVSDNTALCDNETKLIASNLTPDQYDFKWYKDGLLIPDATDANYEASETGNYGLVATINGYDCSFEGALRVEFYPSVNEMTGNPVNLTACDASGFSTFDLTPNVDALLAPLTTPADYSVTIHLTQDDANNGVNAIDSATYTAFANTTENLQTLWTRTVYNTTTCYGIKPFDLIVQDLTPVYTITPDFSICEGTSGTIEVVITDTDSNPVTYTWTKDGAPLAETTASITVTEAGAYTVVLDRTGCTATSTVNVAVIPTPVADAPADVTACGSYELPALSTNNNYYNAATNVLVVAGTVITETTTFNIVASSGTTPECT